MVSRYVIREDSALPGRMMTTVLAQEVLRRERNSAVTISSETRIRIRNRIFTKTKTKCNGEWHLWL